VRTVVTGIDNSKVSIETLVTSIVLSEVGPGVWIVLSIVWVTGTVSVAVVVIRLVKTVVTQEVTVVPGSVYVVGYQDVM
jgi:hypothetical protein